LLGARLQLRRLWEAGFRRRGASHYRTLSTWPTGYRRSSSEGRGQHVDARDRFPQAFSGHVPEMLDPNTGLPGPGRPVPTPEPPGPDLIPEPILDPEPPDARPSPDPQMPPEPRPPELPPEDPRPPGDNETRARSLNRKPAGGTEASRRSARSPASALAFAVDLPRLVSETRGWAGEAVSQDR
jgi:hypothetical protein